MDFLENPRYGASWLSFGGQVTLLSYGVGIGKVMTQMEPEMLCDELEQKLLDEDYSGKKILIFTCLWVIFEYLRSILFTGFPWNLIGYSLMVSNELAQFSSISGIYGLSFIIVFVSSLNLLYFIGLFKRIVPRQYLLLEPV